LAPIRDPNLVNSWGIIIIDKVIWIANGKTSTISSYDFAGNKLFAIGVEHRFQPCSTCALGDKVEHSVRPDAEPLNPTGIVHNSSNLFKFIALPGQTALPAIFLVATENGTVNAYNPLISSTNAITVIDNIGYASYKGLTIADDKLFLADFGANKIVAFDGNFAPVFLPFDTFSDPTLPIGFSPFNICFLNGFLYVTYALKNQRSPKHDIPGPGNGFVSIFKTDGTFVRRFITQGHHNSPWGIILAPPFLGFKHGALLVGNSGDGKINVYDENGQFITNLKDCGNNNIIIEGLKGLAFDHTCIDGLDKTIFFASGPNNESGLFGKLV